MIYYYGSSFFDNEFFVIKRKRVSEQSEDISSKEQLMYQGFNHEHLTKYVMSFYLNKSIYIFLTASNQTLKKILPLKNPRKGIIYFLQVCRAVKYIHDKNLVMGAIYPCLVFLAKNKAQLQIYNLHDVNFGGSLKNFEKKKHIF